MFRSSDLYFDVLSRKWFSDCSNLF